MAHVNANLPGRDSLLGPGDLIPSFAELRGPKHPADLVVVDGTSGEIQVYRSNYRAMFPLEDSQNPFSGVDLGTGVAVACGDIDGDGAIDVLVASDASPVLRHFVIPARAGSKLEPKITE